MRERHIYLVVTTEVGELASVCPNSLSPPDIQTSWCAPCHQNLGLQNGSLTQSYPPSSIPQNGCIACMPKKSIPRDLVKHITQTQQH